MCIRHRTTDDDDRRQTATDASEQNNTVPLGGPVIMHGLYKLHAYVLFGRRIGIHSGPYKLTVVISGEYVFLGTVKCDRLCERF